MGAKYWGVSLVSPSDDKKGYRARLYKHKKQYNLGRYLIAADAAFVYDAAWCLLQKISTVSGEEEKALALATYEDGYHVLGWMDGDDEAGGVDWPGLNFPRPRDYREAREEELAAPGGRKRGRKRALEEPRGRAHREALRVARLIFALPPVSQSLAGDDGSQIKKASAARKGGAGRRGGEQKKAKGDRSATDVDARSTTATTTAKQRGRPPGPNKGEQGATLSREQRWERNFQALVAFKKETGRCIGGREDVTNFSALWTWANNQRSNHKKGKLSRERAARLDGIGFQWTVSRPRTRPRAGEESTDPSASSDDAGAGGGGTAAPVRPSFNALLAVIRAQEGSARGPTRNGGPRPGRPSKKSTSLDAGDNGSDAAREGVKLPTAPRGDDPGDREGGRERHIPDGDGGSAPGGGENWPKKKKRKRKGHEEKQLAAAPALAADGTANGGAPKGKGAQATKTEDQVSRAPARPTPKKARTFCKLNIGTKFVTKFGVLEVVADDGYFRPAERRASVDPAAAKLFSEKVHQRKKRKLLAVERIAAGSRRRREELRKMYVESLSRGATPGAPSLAQKEVWGLYCSSLTSKQILTEGLSRLTKVDDFLRKEITEIDPLYAKDHSSHRIVKCKLSVDARPVTEATRRDDLAEDDKNNQVEFHNRPTVATSQTSMVPMHFYVARRELLQRYKASHRRYACGHCNKYFAARKELKQHLSSCGSTLFDKRAKERNQKRIEIIESKAFGEDHDLLTDYHGSKKPKAKSNLAEFGNPFNSYPHALHKMPSWLVFNAQHSPMYPEIYQSLTFLRGSPNRSHFNKVKDSEGYVRRAVNQLEQQRKNMDRLTEGAKEGVEANSRAESRNSGNCDDNRSNDGQQEGHSQTNITEEDLELARIQQECLQMQRLQQERQRQKPRVVSLDALRTRRRTFSGQVLSLRIFHEKHGRWPSEDDNAVGALPLHIFCKRLRYALRHPGKQSIGLNKERIAILDAIGFE